MRSIHSSGSSIESLLFSLLKINRIRATKHPANYFGNPDFIIKKIKIVGFVDSCFWHGCRRHFRLPKSNTDYWKKKICRNIARDREVSIYYRKKSWKIIRIWEHDLKNASGQNAIINKIQKLLKQ
jgi:DNA mismatch endonuclease (patch repair protein)